MIITIDGPAGAGKTTVSKMLARHLGFRYVDTGALYRGIAYAAVREGIDPGDDAGLESMCRNVDIGFVVKNGDTRLLLNGQDITDLIRTPEITMTASAVSARPVVRKHLLKLQRNMGREGSAVFEGRDMGTVVFPDAPIKYFLDASVQVRAVRRFNEFKGCSSQSLDEVTEDIRRRDKNDSTRDVAPLCAAADAIMIDASEISADHVVEAMLEHINQVFD